MMWRKIHYERIIPPVLQRKWFSWGICRRDVPSPSPPPYSSSLTRRYPPLPSSHHGVILIKIRLTESNAKCRFPKKFNCKGTLRQVFICLRPPPLLWPHTPPALTHCINVYLFTQGRGVGVGGGGELTREKVRGVIVHKAGRLFSRWCHPMD